MTFKNEKELERFILKKCHSALEKSQEKVYKILDKFLNDFYNDYDPSSYIDWDGTVKPKRLYYSRTFELLHSLVKSEIIPSKNGYEAQVYFDYNYLNREYPDGNQPSGFQVMEAAAQGLHGAIGDESKKLQYVEGNTGVGIWDGGSRNPIKELDAKAIEILKNMLIAEGIPIK